MNKTRVFLRRHSSTILTFMGAAGVVATTVMAVKATPKALELIEEEKNRLNNELLLESIANGGETCEYVRELKPLEVVKVAWKPYIPAAITGLSTIACIFGINYLNTRTQASLMSAYALLDKSFKEYREKTEELYKEESDNVTKEILKMNFNDDMIPEDDKELFFDFHGMRYFNSTMEEVETAANILNKKLAMDGYACLNDFYDILGVSHTMNGDHLGWSLMYNDRMYGKPELEFNYDKFELEDGLECTTITIDYPPSIEFIL